jgi:hypothetical protein
LKFSYRKSDLAFRRRYFIRAMRAANLKSGKAAEIAGMNRTAFLAKLKDLKLSRRTISPRSVYSVRPYRIERAEFVRRFFLRIFRRADFSMSAAATLADVNRSHMYRLARRLGVGSFPHSGRNEGNAAWRALDCKPATSSPNDQKAAARDPSPSTSRG